MHQPPLAYFLTWSTYGSWLPGDDRWWTEARHGKKPPDLRLQKRSQAKMSEPALTLSPEQRILVELTIREHCEIRGWKLWALNCRTNHLHVVITATQPPETAVSQFKSWCTRRLKETATTSYIRRQWWTENASTIYLNTAKELESAVIYVRDCQ